MALRKSLNANDLIFQTVEDGFDPDEAERIGFKEDALSDEDARESMIAPSLKR